MEYGPKSEPKIVRLKTPARFTERSRDEITRFTAEGKGLAGLLPDMLSRQQSTIYSVRANLGNALRDVMPFDSPDKNLQIQLVSLDGKKAILTGAIRYTPDGLSDGGVRAEFAFIANPDQLEQEVIVLVSDPGNLDRLVNDLAALL